MTSEELIEIVREELAPVAEGAASELTKVILKVTVLVANGILAKLREEVSGMGSRAYAMASSPEMKGYANACKEVVDEIDRAKIPADPRGRLI